MCFSKVSGPTRKRRVARLEKSLIKRSETLFLSVRILGSINYTYIVCRPIFVPFSQTACLL